MTVDTTELRRLLAEATPIPAGLVLKYEGPPLDPDERLLLALRNEAPALLDRLDELQAELEAMRPYAVRCGWFEDMETAEEWLSEC